MNDMVFSVAKSLLFGFGSAAVLYGAWQFASGVWSGYVKDMRAKEARIAELEYELSRVVGDHKAIIIMMDSILARMTERGTNIYGGQN